MNSDIKLNIVFRFLALSTEEADVLKLLVPETRFGRHHKTKKITGNFPLNESNILIISSFMNDNNIAKEITDIFISFVTEHDTHIMDIPSFVNKAIIKIGSRLTLSYTIV